MNQQQAFTSVLFEQLEAQIIFHHWHISDQLQYTFLQDDQFKNIFIVCTVNAFPSHFKTILREKI
jgi:hypothetical protein